MDNNGDLNCHYTPKVPITIHQSLSPLALQIMKRRVTQKYDKDVILKMMEVGGPESMMVKDNRYGQTPIHWAIWKNCKSDVILTIMNKVFY